MALASAGLVAFVLRGPTHAVGAGLADLRGADPAWLVAAGLAFVASGVASADGVAAGGSAPAGRSSAAGR